MKLYQVVKKDAFTFTKEHYSIISKITLYPYLFIFLKNAFLIYLISLLYNLFYFEQHFFYLITSIIVLSSLIVDLSIINRCKALLYHYYLNLDLNASKNISNAKGKYLLLSLIKTLIISILSLLLIIPGIFYYYRYQMAFYVLSDSLMLSGNTSYVAFDFLGLSSKIMKKHVFDYMLFRLSFVGWFLVGIFTLGIAFIWIVPYYNIAKICFYLSIKDEVVSK